MHACMHAGTHPCTHARSHTHTNAHTCTHTKQNYIHVKFFCVIIFVGFSTHKNFNNKLFPDYGTSIYHY